MKFRSNPRQQRGLVAVFVGLSLPFLTEKRGCSIRTKAGTRFCSRLSFQKSHRGCRTEPLERRQALTHPRRVFSQPGLIRTFLILLLGGRSTSYSLAKVT